MTQSCIVSSIQGMIDSIMKIKELSQVIVYRLWTKAPESRSFDKGIEMSRALERAPPSFSKSFLAASWTHLNQNVVKWPTMHDADVSSFLLEETQVWTKTDLARQIKRMMFGRYETVRYAPKIQINASLNVFKWFCPFLLLLVLFHSSFIAFYEGVIPLGYVFFPQYHLDREDRQNLFQQTAENRSASLDKSYSWVERRATSKTLVYKSNAP